MSWLVKVVLALSIVGILGYDGVSIVHIHVIAADAADQAAMRASEEWAVSKDVKKAYVSAEISAEEAGGTVPPKSLVIEADGTVHLKVRETATTFVLRHIGPLKKFAIINAGGKGQAVS